MRRNGCKAKPSISQIVVAVRRPLAAGPPTLAPWGRPVLAPRARAARPAPVPYVLGRGQANARRPPRLEKGAQAVLHGVARTCHRRILVTRGAAAATRRGAGRIPPRLLAPSPSPPGAVPPVGMPVPLRAASRFWRCGLPPARRWWLRAKDARWRAPLCSWRRRPPWPRWRVARRRVARRWVPHVIRRQWVRHVRWRLVGKAVGVAIGHMAAELAVRPADGHDWSLVRRGEPLLLCPGRGRGGPAQVPPEQPPRGGLADLQSVVSAQETAFVLLLNARTENSALVATHRLGEYGF